MPSIKSRQLGERAGAHGGIIRACYVSPQSVFAGELERTFPIPISIDDTPTSRNIWIVDRTCKVKTDLLRVVVGTPAVAAGAATIMLKKCTGTQAPSAGTNLLNAALSLDDNDTNADTVKTATMVSDDAARSLAVGDRLAVVFAGTLTNLAKIRGVFGLSVVGAVTPVHMLFTARRKCRLMSVILSSDKWAGSGVSSTGEIDITKAVNFLNPISGTTLLTAPIDVPLVTEYSNVEAPLVTTESLLTFNAGDRLCIKFSNGADPTSVNAIAEFVPLPDELFWLSR